MSVTSANNKRIAKNTLALYFRLFFNIAIQLYSVPILLRTLGFSDYGLNNAVGGITALFTFIGGSMASGVQRFLAFEIGRKNDIKLKQVYDTTTSIFLIFSIIVVIIFEIAGTWFLNYRMVIPEGRIYAANWIFQFSIVSFVIALTTIPLYGVVIAHEKMSFYAYLGILTSILKLVAIILLSYIDYDHLILYGLLYLMVQIIERIVYQVYCRKRFQECRGFKLYFDKTLGKEILTYSGFNVIGAIATILRKQGLNIIMNLFFGTLLNAAHSIALHINAVVDQFITNLYMASRPQITKYYAEGKTKEMWVLTYRTSLLAYYLLMMIVIVTYVEIASILEIWLNEYPEYTVEIIRILLISLLIETTINQLSAVFQAMNKIKKWQLCASSILLLNIPVVYIVLKAVSKGVMYPYYTQICFSLLYALSVLLVAKKEIGLNLTDFCSKVLCREMLVTLVCGSVILMIARELNPSFIRIIVTSILTLMVSLIVIMLFGVQKKDRSFIINRVMQKSLKVIR